MTHFDYDSVPDTKTLPMAEAAYSTVKGLKHGYLCAAYVSRNNVPGVIVECGVAQGAQIGMMARAVKDHRHARHFHLFDSFDGIPMAGPHDADQPGIGAIKHDTAAPIEDRLVSSGVSIGSVEQVTANLRRFGVDQVVHMHKGWFQHTIPALADFPSIALLRLDGDLYESTEVCLQYLYPKVVPGGLAVIDDYALPGCRKAVDEYRAAHCPDTELHTEDVGGGAVIATWIK